VKDSGTKEVTVTRVSPFFIGALALSFAASVEAAPSTSVKASAELSIDFEVSDEAALEEDVLAVLDLPLVAHDAREVGIEPEEVNAVIEISLRAGLSAAAATEALEAETKAVRDRGTRKGLGAWVRVQVAEGVTGRELAEKIAERKERKPLSEKEQSKLDKKFEVLKTKRIEQRNAKWTKRKELLAKGQALNLQWKAEHEARKQELKDARAELLAARTELRASGRIHKDLGEHDDLDKEKDAKADDKAAEKIAKADAKAAKKAAKDAKKAAKDDDKAKGKADPSKGSKADPSKGSKADPSKGSKADPSKGSKADPSKPDPSKAKADANKDKPKAGDKPTAPKPPGQAPKGGN
jgi:hypothetical protein